VIGVLAFTAAVIVVWALPVTVRFVPHAPSQFWSMAILALIVDFPLFRATAHQTLRVRTTLSVCFAFAILLVWGPGPAIVVQAVAATVSAIGQRYGAFGALFLPARLVTALAASALALRLAGSPPIEQPGEALEGRDVVAFLLLAAVWLAVSFGLLVVANSVVSRYGWRRTTAGVRSELFATTALMILAAPLLASVAGWWNVLLAIPLIAWNQFSRDQRRLTERLHRDPVTGLLNRDGLVAELEALTLYDRIRRQGPRPIVLLLLYAEALLAINETLGRDIYDKILTIAARRLIGAYGPNLVGRLSGETLVVVRPGVAADAALDRAIELGRLVREPMLIDGVPFAIDSAIGVALYPEHAEDLSGLVAKAELAKGEARRRGLPAMLYRVRSTGLTQRRIDILAHLHAALGSARQRDQVAVAYQPQVDLATRELVGAEALVRWTHPEWGPVPPDEMIKAVEHTEVMHQLTEHVLTLVCAQVREWNDRGLRVRVAVNVSMQDLHDPDFAAVISNLLQSHGIPPNQLTIEITERMLVEDPERATRLAERVSGLGVGLSLDDFGTGFASMQELWKLPLTEVKIDKSYVQGMTSTAAHRAVVTSVHELAQALNLAVVAEGVEDEPTATALATLPGTIGQGYHFGRPAAPEVFEEQWRHHLRADQEPAAD
jgi:diguanylate cyclase (GGDEF)-like protein